MVSPRTAETRLAQLTLVGLAIFAPIETYASWQMLGGLWGLIHPLYIVTFAGMVLMFIGATHSLRARPRSSPALLCIAHAWIAAYGLRSAFWRLNAVGRGLELHFGIVELWATVFAAAVALAAFGVSFVLTLRAPVARGPSPARLRTLESGVAFFSLVSLAVFAPTETVATWQMGGGAAALVGPNFVHKLAGMVLLIIGVRHSLTARPGLAPGALCAAHAWWASTGWSATAGRVYAVSRGARLRWGTPELWLVGLSTLLVLATFSVSFYLTAQQSGSQMGGPKTE